MSVPFNPTSIPYGTVMEIPLCETSQYGNYRTATPSGRTLTFTAKVEREFYARHTNTEFETFGFGLSVDFSEPALYSIRGKGRASVPHSIGGVKCEIDGGQTGQNRLPVKIPANAKSVKVEMRSREIGNSFLDQLDIDLEENQMPDIPIQINVTSHRRGLATIRLSRTPIEQQDPNCLTKVVSLFENFINPPPAPRRRTAVQTAAPLQPTGPTIKTEPGIFF